MLLRMLCYMNRILLIFEHFCNRKPLFCYCSAKYAMWKKKARLLFYNYYSVVFVSLCCFMFSSIQYIIMIFCLFLLPSQTDNNSLDAVMLLWLAGGMHKAN